MGILPHLAPFSANVPLISLNVLVVRCDLFLVSDRKGAVYWRGGQIPGAARTRRIWRNPEHYPMDSSTICDSAHPPENAENRRNPSSRRLMRVVNGVSVRPSPRPCAGVHSSASVGRGVQATPVPP